RIPAGEIRAELIELGPRPLGGDSISVTARIRNAGDRHFYVAGQVTLADSAGVTVAAGDFGAGGALPGTTPRFAWSARVATRAGRSRGPAPLAPGEPELLAGETWLDGPGPAPPPAELARRDHP